jgi:hypothetical protein
VALNNGTIIGLGMLGVREKRSWITRLGLITNQRGKGTGEMVMRGLLANSDQMGIPKNMLEVIKGNTPAHKLFLKLGFENFRELLILRRAPDEVPPPMTEASELDEDRGLACLAERNEALAWTNQTETFHVVTGIHGFEVNTPDGGRGWLIYQKTAFNLSRLMFATYGPDRLRVMRELLSHLHTQYPAIDTYTENIPMDDFHLPVLEEFGYIETFRRVEMFRHPETG